MKRAIAGLGAALVVVLLGIKLAFNLGYIGPPTGQELGTEAVRTMEEYLALVATVRAPQDVKAVEEQETRVRRKALDAAHDYTQRVMNDRAADSATRDRFTEVSDRFLKECKRYDELFAKAHPERPKL
jgi:hypothetical protein